MHVVFIARKVISLAGFFFFGFVVECWYGPAVLLRCTTPTTR
jgi:hypothetical protein